MNIESNYRQALSTRIQKLAQIPESEAAEFVRLFSLKKLAEKQHLLRAGDAARDAAFIATGAVREYFTDNSGNDFNKNFAFAGEFTGSYYDLLSGKPSIASIETLTVTELLIAPFYHVAKFYERSAEWQRVARVTAENLFLKKARREYEFISMTAEERYRQFIAENAAMLDKIPQYHLASYLGITPVALSRIRKRVEKSLIINPG